jgi:putative transposase
MPPRPSSTLQINGKKRHILVDTQGLLMQAVVHAADIQSLPSGLTRGTATAACW